MARPGKIWFIVAAAFAIGNFLGAVFAVMMGEWMHTSLHLGLMALGAAAAVAVARARPEQPLMLTQDDTQIQNIERSIDTIALEVERIGEAQRFIVNQLQSEAESDKPIR